MATLKLYRNAKPDCFLTITINGKDYDAIGYDGVYFKDFDEKDKHAYYARHKENDFGSIASVKKNCGLTANFWGTIVTTDEIDFGDDDEVIVDDYGFEEMN